MKRLVWTFLIFTWLLPEMTLAQRSFLFTNNTIQNGLSQSVVTSMVQDDENTLWIGTQEGLNRYDGYNFENFSSFNDPEITNDHIKTIIKTRDHNLWFGTQDGIFYYDSRREHFQHLTHNFQTSLQIETLEEDNIGNIWAGSYNNGLLWISANTKLLKSFVSTEQTKKISSILVFDPQNIWINASGKLYEVHTKTKEIRKIRLLEDKEITLIKKISNYQILIGTNKGLFSYNPVAKVLSSVLENQLKEKTISALNFDENYYFVGTQTDGLYVINRINLNFVHSRKDKLNPNSIAGNGINAIFKDKTNTIWVGSNMGLSDFELYQNDFNFITTSEFEKYGIPDPTVWCFAENKDGRIIFVGTENNVSFYDRTKGQFTHCRLAINEGGREINIHGASINSLQYVNEDLILVSSSKGLFKLFYNRGNPYFEKIPIKGARNTTDANRIYAIVHYRDDEYFLGTKDGVIKFDLKKNKFESYYHSSRDIANTIVPGICRSIYKAQNGQVYFFTSEGGMSVYEENRDKIIPYKFNRNILHVTKEYVTSAVEIGDKFWLGTSGAGLIALDKTTGSIQKFDKHNGLVNNVIYGTLKDKENHIWVSTNRGIAKFDPKTKQFDSFYYYGNVLSSEYNQGAFFKTQQGEMLFGGINGYVFFNPDKIHDFNRNLEVSIISLSIGKNIVHPEGKNKILSTAINLTRQLILKHTQNNFSLRITSENISHSKLVKYKYLLEGNGKDEVILENQNIIHFSSLQPGRYKLKIYAKIGNSAWSSTPKTIEIKIEAPFWNTIWFWVTASFILAFGTLIYTRRRIELSRRDQVILEMKIHERTEEIREQNHEIRKQYAEIQKKNIEIKEQGDVISKKNEILVHQTKQLELEKSKTDKLLKNILPETTFTELKDKGRVSARSYSQATILFTDFVGFTKISEKMRPTEIINQLDIYFSEFDKIIVENNLEKIKMIGDAYMCAGGIPIRNRTNPIDACLAGLKIQQYVKQRQLEQEKIGETVWKIRLGINTGEIVAGVIGKKKLAYDIWGSAVNMANRMEMTGSPDEVTISGATFELVQYYFDCDFKRKVLSKSNDIVDVYTVKRIKEELSEDEYGIIPNKKFWELTNLHLYSQINYRKAEKHILQLLKEKLPPHLHYHCIEHTFDVVRAAERIAVMEGITDENLYLLKTAALYHDAGFVEQYDKNEHIGASMAEEILPQYGYSPEQIATIKSLIFVTEVPQKPKNHLEQIICDADLDYLGRDDFYEIADRLRVELRENGKLNSDKLWDETQIKFLTAHKYFTKTAIETRLKKKKEHIQFILNKLKTYNYKD